MCRHTVLCHLMPCDKANRSGGSGCTPRLKQYDCCQNAMHPTMSDVLVPQSMPHTSYLLIAVAKHRGCCNQNAVGLCHNSPIVATLCCAQSLLRAVEMAYKEAKRDREAPEYLDRTMVGYTGTLGTMPNRNCSTQEVVLQAIA